MLFRFAWFWLQLFLRTFDSRLQPLQAGLILVWYQSNRLGIGSASFESVWLRVSMTWKGSFFGLMSFEWVPFLVSMCSCLFGHGSMSVERARRLFDVIQIILILGSKRARTGLAPVQCHSNRLGLGLMLFEPVWFLFLILIEPVRFPFIFTETSFGYGYNSSGLVHFFVCSFFKPVSLGFRKTTRTKPIWNQDHLYDSGATRNYFFVSLRFYNTAVGCCFVSVPI